MFGKVINKVSSTASAGASPTHRPSVSTATIVGATIAESVGATAPGPGATITSGNVKGNNSDRVKGKKSGNAAKSIVGKQRKKNY
jgi:hypothetical protein